MKETSHHTKRREKETKIRGRARLIGSYGSVGIKKKKNNKKNVEKKKKRKEGKRRTAGGRRNKKKRKRKNQTRKCTNLCSVYRFLTGFPFFLLLLLSFLFFFFTIHAPTQSQWLPSGLGFCVLERT